ncbi:MAG: glycosyltransferase family 39 protein, partial [Nitrosarchaeum sp.]|nr:glycosyltransferase family 39 protein [Nitrosarchaeum sp.]
MQRRNLALLTLLATLLVTRILLALTYRDVYWDEAVYVAMGKYLLSAGASGFAEWIRPPLLPLIAGTLWKIGLDPLVAGRALSMLASILASAAFYLFLRRELGTPQALVGAALIGITPLAMLMGTKFLGESLILLLTILLLIAVQRRNAILTGASCALILLTKFNAAILIIALGIFMLIPPEKVLQEMREEISDAWRIGGGIGFIAFGAVFGLTAIYSSSARPEAQAVASRFKGLLLAGVCGLILTGIGFTFGKNVYHAWQLQEHGRAATAKVTKRYLSRVKDTTR